MKSPLPCSLCLLVTKLALACLLVIGTSGCATDSEYNQKLATARTDWKGSEIVGIWVAKLSRMKMTLLLRPGGTGESVTKGPGGIHWESNITWRYAGGGLWTGSGRGKGFMDRTTTYALNADFHLNYNGSELLLKEEHFNFGGHMYSIVFVPAENEAAVDSYLEKR